MISLSRAEAEFHEVVNGTARRLFINSSLQAMERKAVVRMGTHASVAVGITQGLRAGRVRHLEIKDLWIRERRFEHMSLASRK